MPSGRIDGYDEWGAWPLPFCSQCGQRFEVAIERNGWPVTETCGCSTRKCGTWKWGRQPRIDPLEERYQHELVEDEERQARELRLMTRQEEEQERMSPNG